MRALLALMQRSLGRAAGIAAGLTLVLVSVQFLLVIIAASQYETQSFDLLSRMAPAFVQRQFGSALPAFLSFSGLVTFGYFHPVVVLSVALFAVFIASELAADVEGGQVDLLLARPVTRHWLVTRSVLLIGIGPVILVTSMTVASRIALAAFAPNGAGWPQTRAVISMAAHLVAVAWCFGALGLATAAVVRRRMNALGPIAILAVSLYLLDALAGAWPPMAWSAVLSPFHYYNGANILAGTADTARDLAVLGAMSVVATAIAYWRFSARDL